MVETTETMGVTPLLPDNVLDIVIRAYVVADVGGVVGYGPEKGRRFEKLFYDICDRRGVFLSEKAGSRSLGLQKTASGFGHEVDAATRSPEQVTHWEMKHLTAELPKNEMLIFNGKGLDFLFGSAAMFARIPSSRFLLSGSNVRDECRFFGILWGIMIIEPGLLPLPLIYEAVARGASVCLRKSEEEAVMNLLPWACRPLQHVVKIYSSGRMKKEKVHAAGPARLALRRRSWISRSRSDPTSWITWTKNIPSGLVTLQMRLGQRWAVGRQKIGNAMQQGHPPFAHLSSTKVSQSV
jgi:hypothetical protein